MRSVSGIGGNTLRGERRAEGRREAMGMGMWECLCISMDNVYQICESSLERDGRLE